MAQLVKNPSAMQETWVQSLGWEDTLEKGNTTHFSILAWRIPWTIQSMGSQRVGHNSEWLSLSLRSLARTLNWFLVKVLLISNSILNILERTQNKPWTCKYLFKPYVTTVDSNKHYNKVLSRLYFLWQKMSQSVD